jgi:hypothetical protein
MQMLARNEHVGAALFELFGPAAFGPSAQMARARRAAPTNVADLVERLAVLYPVTRRLAGDESFFGAASGFIFTELPRAPERVETGEAFPRFLRSLGRTAAIEYLADIAELEWARGKARRTIHVTQIAAHDVATVGHLDTRRVRLHPSASLIASRFPILTIWEANQANGEAGMIQRWAAEAVLVARPRRSIEMTRLPAGGHAFLRSLMDGGTVAGALAAGQAGTAAFDADANLALLAESRIVVDPAIRTNAYDSRAGKTDGNKIV